MLLLLGSDPDTSDWMKVFDKEVLLDLIEDILRSNNLQEARVHLLEWKQAATVVEFLAWKIQKEKPFIGASYGIVE